MSETIGPFHLRGYDTFQDEYYDIHPVEEHTHDTYEEAYKDAESEMEQINEMQPADEVGELQDVLFIVDSQGNHLPYVQQQLN